MNSSRQFAWQTSNMEYGRFYGGEDERRRLLEEREGRCEVLTKTLIDCRNQLGLMRLRNSSPSSQIDDVGDPPTSSYYDAHLQRIKMAQLSSPRIPGHNSTKTYSEPEEAKSSHLPAENIINADGTFSAERTGRIDPTGIEEDTKQLEWILNRLADKLQPLTSGGLPILKFTPTKPEFKKEKPDNNQVQIKSMNQSKQMQAERPAEYRLPAHSRYGFYRCYGYGGQGAKTSWGHNLPLGQKPPHGKRAKSVFKY